MKINLSDYTYRIIFILLIIGTVTVQYLYVGSKELQLFRLMLLLCLFYIFTHLLKKQIKIDKVMQKVLLFFSIYYFWATLISVIFDNLTLSDFLNFSILYIYILLLVLFISYKNNKFIETFYRTSITIFFISVFISIWEIITHNHLPGSMSDNTVAKWEFVPTAFYGNPNQLASTLSLIVLFVFTYNNSRKKHNYLLLVTMIVSAGLIDFFAQAKTNVLVLFIIGLLYFSKPKTFIYIIIIGMFIFFFSDYFLRISENYFDIDIILQSFSLEAGHSTNIRKALYMDALYSLSYNHGLGFGINASSYYIMLNDPQLYGITSPHNYLLEMLIIGGFFIIILYTLLNIYLMYLFYKSKHYILMTSLLIYYLILISNSGALFDWYSYMFFIALLGLPKYTMNTKE